MHNGCKQRARGSKELLVIDSVVTRQAKKHRKNLSIAWVDYQKAYDSVPHSWLVQIMEIYKVDHKILQLLKHLMNTWTTTLSIKGDKISYRTRKIKIKRGIFQGDSLSPLWFCMALNPLSSMLNRSAYAYSLEGDTKLSHLFYMDDIKLYAKGSQQLQGELELVKSFSDTIQMKFGLDKCAVLHTAKGKIISTGNVTLTEGGRIEELGPDDAYKYLGIQQTFEIRQKENKEQAERELMRRTFKILKTYLNAKNKITAINTWAIPSIAYTFGIISWSATDLQKLDRKIRTALTKHRMLHPNSAIERLYVPRGEGGRGLRCLEIIYQKEITNLKAYFQNINTPFHQRLIALDKTFTPLRLAEQHEPESDNKLVEMNNKWRTKALHGRYYTSLHHADVDTKSTNIYLTAGYLFSETEGSLLAIQDQVIPTRTYLRVIMKQTIPSVKCRWCNKEDESVQHIISGCSYLAPTWYLSRHNNMGKVVHQLMALQLGLISTFTPYHQYTPKPLLENDKCKIYWDLPVITDRPIQANRPDLIVWNKLNKTATIVDFAVPLDENIGRTYMEKINKYQELAFEIKDIWRLNKVQIIPFVISANGLIHKKALANLKTLDVSETALVWMQKAVILGTVAIVRRTLNR